MQMDIFFFITTIAVVIFTILLCIVIYQIIKILKTIRRIVDRVDQGAEVLAEDIDSIRSSLNPTRLVSFIVNLLPTGKK